MKRNEMKLLNKDAVLLFILSKIDQYEGEKEFFENKYRRNFQEVEQKAHAVKGKEDFNVEEDLEDWEFALKSLEYWGNEYKNKQYRSVLPTDGKTPGRFRSPAAHRSTPGNFS